MQQRRIVAGFPHQYAAEQLFAIFTDHDFFIDLRRAVGPLITQAAGCAPVGIAERRHINAKQFQLCAHIRTGKRRRFAAEMSRHYTRHLISWRHQTIDFALPHRTFANGEDVFIRGLALFINVDPAAFPQVQRPASGKRILRANAGGEHHHVGRQALTIGKVEGERVAIRHDFPGRLAGMNLHPQRGDFLAQHSAALFIQLNGHQRRGELHHVGFQPQLF